MRGYNQMFMIWSYLWSGVCLQRSYNHFNSGNTEGGWWTLLAAVIFSALGSGWLVLVKKNTKKEEK